MKKSMEKVKDEMNMDMTPMIDCVFLLMIFFVLVIDLSQQDLEDLILPKAEFQEPDDSPPKVRPIVNITQDGKVIYKGEIQYDPLLHKDDYSEMLALLKYFKQNIVPPEEKKMEPLGPGGANVEVVDTPILIRADKWTEWHYVGKIMEQCSKPEAAFWKLELAMSEEDKEDKLFRNR